MIDSWKNGKWIPNSEIGTSLWDAHYFFGWAVFEAIRTYNHKPFLLDEHLDRLYMSAKLASIKIIYTKKEIRKLIYDVIEHNKTFFKNDEYRIMIFASPGFFKIYKDMGSLDPILTINATTVSRYAPHIAPYLDSGYKGIIVSQRQIPSRYLDPRIKSCSRLHYGMADIEASKHGPGSIPILLDEHGNITESSGGNICFMKDESLCIPRDNNILRGCTLEIIKKLTDINHINIIERDWDPYDLINSDGALHTSTFSGLVPITSITYKGNEYKLEEKGFYNIHTIIKYFDEIIGLDSFKQWRDYNKNISSYTS